MIQLVKSYVRGGLKPPKTRQYPVPKIQQSKAQPLVMGIALHPYIAGQPFRLRYLRRALKHIVSAKRAWLTTPGAITYHMDGLLKRNKAVREFFARHEAVPRKR